ncbi:MAG: glycosyltransferase, partial [Pseudomonadota bacterium]
MGGADRQSVVLTEKLQSYGHEVKIVSLTRLGDMGVQAVRQGLDIDSLQVRPGRIPFGKLAQLRRIVRSWRPSLIQGWMYHGNLAASLAGLFAHDSTPVTWGIRHSLYDLKEEKPLTRQVVRIGASLSGRAKVVIYNSQEAVKQHEQLGFDPTKSHVIPNGFDCDLYYPRKN